MTVTNRQRGTRSRVTRVLASLLRVSRIPVMLGLSLSAAVACGGSATTQYSTAYLCPGNQVCIRSFNPGTGAFVWYTLWMSSSQPYVYTDQDQPLSISPGMYWQPSTTPLDLENQNLSEIGYAVPDDSSGVPEDSSVTQSSVDQSDDLTSDTSTSTQEDDSLGIDDNGGGDDNGDSGGDDGGGDDGGGDDG
ncbi:MAG TPA: hypothetical protein VEK76_03725 [Candidatus Binatia bacterium]|nr:hypothetical protein [Candidatus Binatia bacterium]